MGEWSGRGLDRTVVAATIATAGFAVAALVRPEALSGATDGEGTRYYAGMFAARSIPLAAATLVAVSDGRPEAVRPVLYAAAAAQVGDAVVGARTGRVGQIVAPLLTGVLFAVRASRGRRSTHVTRSGVGRIRLTS